MREKTEEVLQDCKSVRRQGKGRAALASAATSSILRFNFTGVKTEDEIARGLEIGEFLLGTCEPSRLIFHNP